ncbi:MAG: response regulator transcription factor [Dehalococcoidia bacterium]|nr:response regulator transcription factor [Dehalococcoidia bacterium]
MPKTTRARIFILTDDNALMRELSSALQSGNLDCVRIPYSREAIVTIGEENPNLLILDMDAFRGIADGLAFSRRLKTETRLPIIILLSEDALGDFGFTLAIDDFAVKPCKPVEMLARIKNVLLRKSNIESESLIKHGDLMIDLVKYEVSVAGRIIDLSFKEYELLKVLVSNKGRVLNRQILLDKVWGYDYYGGDRTVDVHIRRLRSKIEDADHSFVQTVRNVGYKFKEADSP